MDYNLLKTFSKVAELGSFTKAAKILNQPKSRVSRAISRLESQLNVQLIRRTTRKTSLTESGQSLYKKIYPLLNGINNELIKITDQQIEMSGTIRITTSEDIGQTLVTRIISAYQSKYPKVRFETIITNDFVDLIKEDVDIAFRAGKLQDSSLIQKKFISTNFILVASPKYLEFHPQPTTLDELKNHNFFSFKTLNKEIFGNNFELTPQVTSDSLSILLKMVLNHEGTTFLPDFFCQEYLKNKTLFRIIPSWKSKTGNIHILYPPSKMISKRVKTFIEMANELYKGF
ncbi:LysR substrate-binding domain-containing protein [Bacteriovoracaceae bacterium]|nr:LysR substrate-binding domain-containing protein [Bacteriovoracaceae bacterium]